MNRLLVGLGILLVSAAALAAGKNIAPPDPLPGTSRSDCFAIRFARDRRVLDTKRLVVWANGHQPFLVELDRPLQYLDSGGQSIVLIDGDGDGQVCRSLRDAIVVQDTLLPKRRLIVAVTSLEEGDIRTLEQKYNTSLARKRRGQWGSGDEAQATDESPTNEATNGDATPIT